MAITILGIEPLDDGDSSHPPSCFDVELVAGGRRWSLQLGTWVTEQGMRVYSPKPHVEWMQLYQECESVSGPADVLRAVVRVQQGEALTFPLAVGTDQPASA